MCRFTSAIVVVVGLMLSLTADAASRCSVCRKKITGRSLVSQSGVVYCTKACFSKTLPQCASCKKRIQAKHLSNKGKRYCSMNCFKKILPKCELCAEPMQTWKSIQDHKFCPNCCRHPRCGECMLPVASPKLRYTDGRVICKHCSQFVLQDKEKITQYYLRARAELKKITGHESDVLPGLRLVDTKKIQASVQEHLRYMPAGVVRGFYHRIETFREDSKKPVRIRKSIYMLHGMKANNYVITGVHEFTHDMIAERYERLKDSPMWVQEGLCQYTASIVAHRFKLTNYYRSIQEHPGCAYGDGFRFFQKKFGKDNWAGVDRWIRSVNVKRLPETAPK